MKAVFLIFALVLLSPCACAADLGAFPARARVATGGTGSGYKTFESVSTTGRGQAGYVHYFLITHPNGESEYQVGLELDDQRIAWSFPGAGVTVSGFTKNGTLTVNGSTFRIEHLHGIRPFVADGDMRVLQRELPRRVAQWIDDETPYCVFRTPGQPFCLNCGDFVLRILYPGAHPLIPALPEDFARATGQAATADDLLFYLAGLHKLPGPQAMRGRLAALDLPTTLRDDLLAMIEGIEQATKTTSTSPAPAALPAPPNPAPGRRFAGRRTPGKKI